jgi:ERCC4-type nuclease
MPFKLLIDDREKKVIPYFLESYDFVELEVKRLHIGDYAITKDNEILIIIERKSWEDLSASIKDNRIENVEKLLSTREKTNCKILYLIEGKARYSASKKIARIPYKSLLAHLDHLMIRDNIHIIYSNNEEDSATRLIELCKNYISINPNKAKSVKSIGGGSHDPVQEPTQAIGGESCDPVQEPTQAIGRESHDQNMADILTTVVPKSDLQIIYNIWCQIPNITTKTATIFIEAGYHISDLLLGNISKMEISLLKYPNGTIIGKRANKILQVVKDNDINFKHYCNLMAEIPLITKKTAEVILQNNKLVDILNKKLSINELANIKKTEKAKIGNKAAGNIYKFLIK